MYCSNSILLEQFFLVFNCIFPRFLGSKSDSRNHFHFSACGLEVEKCFLNHFLNLDNLGKMQFQTRKNFSRSELEQYPKQNTITESSVKLNFQNKPIRFHWYKILAKLNGVTLAFIWQLLAKKMCS